MRGFKIAHAALREQLQKAEAKIERLLEQRQEDAEADPGQRSEDAEDGEEADRRCDQDGRLPGGDANCWGCSRTTMPEPTRKAARCFTPRSNRPRGWKSPRANCG